MNVVIAALSAPSQLNGVSRHAANLVRALLSTGNISNVHFICGEWQKEMFRCILPPEDARLHVHQIQLRDVNLHRLLWYFREMPEIAAQLEADIVHFTHPAPIGRGSYLCPTVLSLHDLYPFDIPENFGFLKSALARRTVMHSLKQVNAIACASESTRTRLAERFPLETVKATVIQNVVELLPPSSADSDIESLNGRTFIFCIAQHRPNKNVPLAIRIFERALEKRVLDPEARLLVAGIPGPDTKKIQRQIKQSHLCNRVLLLSGLSEGGLRWCYDHCALLLAPSSIEGFGLPVAEGILAGCRITCSDIPAFREIAGATCRFVGWGAELLDNYAEAIREVLALPKPPAKPLPEYCAASIGRKYVALYENLICSGLPEFGMLRQPEAVSKAFNR
jgi:glycosyltransferase involved in cell wall biosynthesis